MSFSARLLIVICLVLVTFSVNASHAFAQTNPYNVPNTDANVPANQHTRVQTLFIDILAATVCVLAGVDPVDTSKPCLDVNPQTGKIGYNPASFDENGEPKLGGVLGASTQMIAMMYTPTISGKQYTSYLAQNFGIVKPAYAQDVGYGFRGLDALLSLWTAMRNLAYFILMIAFILIGLGIMLRIELAPRTIMTIQNQIPRIIICILLVTFSYGIAGLMIDAMWLTTYVGINVITSAGGAGGASPTNPIIPGTNGQFWGEPNPKDPNTVTRPLSEVATLNLLQMPINYVNSVFRTPEEPGSDQIDIGIKTITVEVAYSISQFLEQLVKQLLNEDPDADCGIGLGGFSFRGCLASIMGFIAKILLWIIILVTIMKTLFSVWFTLLKAYTYVIIYSIAGPFFIVMGLLPGKVLGFEKWARSLFANLAVFPATAFIFVLARLFVELFKDSDNDRFIPPLVGNPDIVGLMGWLIAFGLILMSPTVLAMLQESLKVTGTKYGSAIGAGLAAGAAGPKAAFGAAWQHATRNTKLHEHDAGWLRQMAAGKGAKDDQRAPIRWINKQRSKLVRFGGKASGH